MLALPSIGRIRHLEWTMYLSWQEQRALAALRLQGFKAARRRGHNLGLFFPEDQTRQTATCRCCGKYVQIILKPQPNEIDVGGDALSLYCEVNHGPERSAEGNPSDSGQR